MKKLLLLFAVVGMTLGFSSCKDECCDCSNGSGFSGDVCEEDLPAGLNWNSYKNSLEAAGCDCD